jgi:SagB-type dehydrogenase family enzyme
LIALRYHEATKHYFNRFARSRGYLDWATQPDPFRRFAGAPCVELPREPIAPDVSYDALFARSAPPVPIDGASIADWLRCAMGLSAWKQYRSSRWALRVNPSSGNLHPTEAYLVSADGVFHYAPREHLLERRTTLDRDAWRVCADGRHGFLVALTSIHWREAWKYGERAFRYCQHDTGHAIGALALSAARLGWSMMLLPRWSDPQLAAVLGLDRDRDFASAEREEPECVAVVTADDPAVWLESDPRALVGAARAAVWTGTANQLSPDRVEWSIIDEVAQATQYPGVALTAKSPPTTAKTHELTKPSSLHTNGSAPRARDIIVQRRSAVAFDPRSAVLSKERFVGMLSRLQPSGSPWDAIDWPPHVHLAVFVHRVDGLTPGVYAYLRDASAAEEWRKAMRQEFLWEQVSDRLFLLLPADVTWVGNRVSCDQEIAGDGFFSLGMIARLAPSLAERGEWFYRRLFWECGLIGQVLYLEAEAAGARATGIGCFYDDAVHELLGLTGDTWQSLYHFSMGVPVDDTRLTTEPGYAWETNAEIAGIAESSSTQSN